MKKLSIDEIKEIYNNCNIGFNENDLKEFQNWSYEIIKAINSLKKINVQNEEPMFFCNDNEICEVREDDLVSNLNKDDVLKNAPNHDNDFITIVKVIDKNEF